jgi:hypothetical protein
MAASAAAASLRTVLVALYQKYIVGEVSAVRGDAALPAVDAATGALVFPVGVAPDEVAEEVAASRAFLESAVGALRLKIEADSKLQAQGLSDAERKALSAELEALEDLIANLAEVTAPSAEDPEEVRAAQVLSLPQPPEGAPVSLGAGGGWGWEVFASAAATTVEATDGAAELEGTARGTCTARS